MASENSIIKRGFSWLLLLIVMGVTGRYVFYELVSDFFSGATNLEQVRVTPNANEPDFYKEPDLQQRQLDLLLQENRELRQMLGLPDRYSFEQSRAQVIHIDTVQGGRKFRINIGAEQGVEVGNAVTANGFLVGRVDKVSNFASTVLTILDPNCKIPVFLPDNQTVGVMNGSGSMGWRRHHDVKLTKLPRDMNYQEGMGVLSSDFSVQMPRQIPIGFITKRAQDIMVSSTIDNLYKECLIRPGAFDKSFSFVNVYVPVRNLQNNP